VTRDVLVVVCLIAAGCSRKPARLDAPDASLPSAASEPAPPVERGSDEIKPVYPIDAGPPDPQATRFCGAVQLLPETRKTECCPGSNLVPMAAEQCVRMLTAALEAHAVQLAPGDLDRCVDAMTRATQGCDWVTSSAVPVPPECKGILRGTRAPKDRCRSSLECRDGLRCQGLSAIDVGTCAPPKADSLECNTAIDVLAAFTRQDDLDRAHPECVGYCARKQCKDLVPAGGACKSDIECGRGRCEGGRCTSAPLPASGDPCVDACAYGAKCLKGKCAPPKGEGESCELGAQCRGSCAGADGGGAGTCAKACPKFPLRRP
jgi:hypothetical protein